MNKTSNVIQINRDMIFPDDLMSFKEITAKYRLKYGFLYKWSVRMKEIKTYSRGCIVISERDLLKFLDKRGRKWRAS